MSQENFPQPEQNLPPEPTLEAQRVLFDEIKQENGRQLLAAGILEKARNTRLDEVYKVGHSALAGSELSPTNNWIRNQEHAAARERAIEPSEYSIDYQIAGGEMTEFYGISWGARNILVGRTHIEHDGTVRLVPEKGFGEDDVATIKKMADNLAEKRASGELPDITSDFHTIYNPDKERNERPVEAMPDSKHDTLTELKQQQAERAKREESVISNFVAYGASERQIKDYRETLTRMKTAELERGRLFPHQAGFTRFEALIQSEKIENLAMGMETGFEQGDWVAVRRTSGKVEYQWTFMGVNKQNGLAMVATFDELGRKLYKNYSIEELKKLNSK